jgi:hypothetical protein
VTLMRSLWLAHYHGNDVHRFTKKLQHRLAIPLLETKHQVSAAHPSDYIIQFYVEHPPAESEAALFHLLVVSQRLGTPTSLQGDVREFVQGTCVVTSHAPIQGLVSCCWRFRRRQDYERFESVFPAGAA